MKINEFIGEYIKDIYTKTKDESKIKVILQNDKSILSKIKGISEIEIVNVINKKLYVYTNKNTNLSHYILKIKKDILNEINKYFLEEVVDDIYIANKYIKEVEKIEKTNKIKFQEIKIDEEELEKEIEMFLIKNNISLEYKNIFIKNEKYRVELKNKGYVSCSKCSNLFLPITNDKVCPSCISKIEIEKENYIYSRLLENINLTKDDFKNMEQIYYNRAYNRMLNERLDQVYGYIFNKKQEYIMSNDKEKIVILKNVNKLIEKYFKLKYRNIDYKLYEVEVENFKSKIFFDYLSEDNIDNSLYNQSKYIRKIVKKYRNTKILEKVIYIKNIFEITKNFEFTREAIEKYLEKDLKAYNLFYEIYNFNKIIDELEKIEKLYMIYDNLYDEVFYNEFKIKLIDEYIEDEYILKLIEKIFKIKKYFKFLTKENKLKELKQINDILIELKINSKIIEQLKNKIYFEYLN